MIFEVFEESPIVIDRICRYRFDDGPAFFSIDRLFQVCRSAHTIGKLRYTWPVGKTILFVGLGGFIGSVARYLIYVAGAKAINTSFPYSTFIVNIAGCFLIGIIYGLAERQTIASQEFRAFLTAGLCGGFTTFSTFAFENLALVQERNYLTFALYSAASLVIGIAAAALGIKLSGS